MNKYIFFGIEIAFCIIWTFLSLGGRSRYADIIGYAVGTSLWLILVPYGWVYLFSKKCPHKHLKAFIISAIIFLLFCAGHFQGVSVNSADSFPKMPPAAIEQNKEALFQASKAVENFSVNKDSNQFRQALSQIKETEYTAWLRETMISFSQGMQQLISDLQLDHEIFADPYILSSKSYLDDAIGRQQKILNAVSDKLIEDKLKTLWENSHNQMYHICIRSYTDNICQEIRRGFSSLNNDFSLVSHAAKKRLEYLQEEVSLARFISRNYDNIDKKAKYPSFKNDDLQKSLQKKLQKLMNLSSDMENMRQNSMNKMRRTTSF